MLMSLFLAAKPSGLPTIENILVLFFLASFIALIKFKLTFFSHYLLLQKKLEWHLFSYLDTFKYSEKIVSKPSSLVLAVNSETLSVGAYASILQSFLKSFTA